MLFFLSFVFQVAFICFFQTQGAYATGFLSVSDFDKPGDNSVPIFTKLSIGIQNTGIERNGFFRFNMITNPTEQSGVADLASCIIGPGRNTLRFSEGGNHGVISSISALSFPIGIVAIFRRVGAIVFPPLNTKCPSGLVSMLQGPFSKYKKVSSPFITDEDSTSTISFVGFVTDFVASANHTSPNFVNGIVSPSRKFHKSPPVTSGFEVGEPTPEVVGFRLGQLNRAYPQKDHNTGKGV